MNAILIIAGTVAAVFSLYWCVNPKIPSGRATFREWWRNQPTARDPEKWERFMDDRK